MNKQEQPEAKSLDDSYFIKNAIHCWLYYFPEHKWADIYQDLAKKEFIQKEESEPKPTPRPARRRKATAK